MPRQFLSRIFPVAFSLILFSCVAYQNTPTDPMSLKAGQKVRILIDAENDLKGKVILVDSIRFGFENNYTRMTFKHREPLAVYVQDKKKSRTNTYILGGVILILIIGGLSFPIVAN